MSLGQTKAPVGIVTTHIIINYLCIVIYLYIIPHLSGEGC